MKNQTNNINKNEYEKLKIENCLMKKISSADSLNDLLDDIVQYLNQYYGFDSIGIQLVDEKENVLKYFNTYGIPVKNESLLEITKKNVPLINNEISVSAKVALTKKYHYADFSRSQHLDNMSNLDKAAVEALGLKENLIIPIVNKNKTIAVIHLSNYKNSLNLSEDDISNICDFTNSISSIINITKEHYELKKLKELQEETIKLVRKISTTIEISDLLDLLGYEILKIDTFNAFSINFLDDDKKNLITEKVVLPKGFTEMEKAILHNKTPVDTSLSMQIAVNEKKVVFVNDDNAEQFGERTKHTLFIFNLKSAVYLPITNGNELLGVIILMSSEKKELDEVSVEMISSRVSLFFEQIKNALFYSRLKTREESIESSRFRNKRVIDLTEKLNSLTSVEKIYDIISKELAEIWNFSISVMFIRKDSLLRAVKGYGTNLIWQNRVNKLINFYLKEGSGGYYIDSNDGASSNAYLNNSYFFFNDARDIMKLPMSEKDKIALKTIEDARTFLIMPIRRDNKPIGVILLIGLDENKNLITDIDIKTIESLCAFAGRAILNSEVYTLVETQKELLTEKNRIISEDLHMARRIQEKILSTGYKDINEIDVNIRYEPKEAVGGDFYDINKLSDGIIRIFIGDATGHGVQGALITMLIKSEWDKIKVYDLAPSKVLEIFNNIFVSNYQNLNVFFTCVIIDININESKVIYSSAGHPDQYLLSGEKLTSLHAGGKMVGIEENIIFETRDFPFNINDKLFLFTDGLFEEFDENNNIFGEERLEQVIKQNINIEIIELNKKVLEAVEEFRKNKKSEDDITCMIIQRKK